VKVEESGEIASPRYDRRVTDFVAVGTVTYNTPGLDKDIPYLVYEEAGRPGLSKRLVFDEVSWCGTPDGGTECLAMSTSAPFVGDRVSVDGILEGETVLVRKLQTLRENLPPILAGPGAVYILWSEAVELIKDCDVEMVLQAHSLNVGLTLKTGDQLRAVEPTIDEVFRVLAEYQDKCGQIPVAME
jgi:hypothetical protein